jgi:hypothetical protein
MPDPPTAQSTNTPYYPAPQTLILPHHPLRTTIPSTPLRNPLLTSPFRPIGAINTPGFARKGLVHKVMSFKEGPFSLHGFDDEVEFNTQCSSQWDSLVHFHHQPSGTGYNGCKPSVKELEQTFGNQDTDGKLPTLHHWHTRGGLVGRGVLLDYRAWKESKGESYDCFDSTTITIKELEEIAKWEKVELKHGDVCIVRSGFTEDLGHSDAKKQEEQLGSHKCIGVEGNTAAAKWFWNHHFSAVAGDAIAFEVLPPKREDGSHGGIDELGESRILLFVSRL